MAFLHTVLRILPVAFVCAKEKQMHTHAANAKKISNSKQTPQRRVAGFIRESADARALSAV
jgi:hypothetical protein